MLRDDYPLGVPCWVDTFQPDPESAAAFYSVVFGWVFDAPAAGGYLTARLGEHRVAGIGQAPAGAPAFWCTYVRVDRVDFSLAQVAAEGGTVLVGPLSAGAGGSMGVVSDPAGIAFALCDQLGAEVVNEPNTWAMGALHTPDLSAAGDFYGALFGWQLEPVPGTPLSVWRLPGYVGGAPGQALPRDVVAVATTTTETVPPHWAVNFRVDDADATCERAVGGGGTLLMPPTDAPGFRNAVIADPQGGVVAISAPDAV